MPAWRPPRSRTGQSRHPPIQELFSRLRAPALFHSPSRPSAAPCRRRERVTGWKPPLAAAPTRIALMGAALLGFGVIRRRPPTLVAMPWGWFLVGLGILILAA